MSVLIETLAKSLGSEGQTAPDTAKLMVDHVRDLALAIRSARASNQPTERRLQTSSPFEAHVTLSTVHRASQEPDGFSPIYVLKTKDMQLNHSSHGHYVTKLIQIIYFSIFFDLNPS